jgi:peptidase C13-like protein
MTVIHRSLLHRTAAICGLLFVLTAASAASQTAAKVAVVAFGLFGDQSVFASDARDAARIIATRFGGDPVVVRANTKTRADATPETLAGALHSVALRVDPERDVLFLMLTSHGSRDGLVVQAGSRSETLSPPALSAMLAFTGVRHRVVILSACYSGIFIPALAGPDTLVITAADADHPSFGCKDGAKWTYFDEAFFNAAFRHTTNLREAFALARNPVRQRERRAGFEPSNPQMSGGENVTPLLDRLIASSPQPVDRSRQTATRP